MTTLTRRKALTIVAAAPVAVAMGVVPALAEGSDLAALIRRYFAEIAAFNASPLDDDEYFLGDQPFDGTLRKMIGVPAQTAEDAVAAIDWIIYEGEHSMIELGGDQIYGQVAGSLVHAVRGYLEGRAG